MKDADIKTANAPDEIRLLLIRARRERLKIRIRFKTEKTLLLLPDEMDQSQIYDTYLRYREFIFGPNSWTNPTDVAYHDMESADIEA